MISKKRKRIKTTARKNYEKKIEDREETEKQNI